MYIILEWQYGSPINVISEDYGEPLVFTSRKAAIKYAVENCAFSYKIFKWR